MARYKKGQSGNPAGKPKGAVNKTTRELREMIQRLLEDNYELVVSDMLSLAPKDRVTAWLNLAEFALPKLARTTIDSDSEDGGFSITVKHVTK